MTVAVPRYSDHRHDDDHVDDNDNKHNGINNDNNGKGIIGIPVLKMCVYTRSLHSLLSLVGFKCLNRSIRFVLVLVPVSLWFLCCRLEWFLLRFNTRAPLRLYSLVNPIPSALTFAHRHYRHRQQQLRPFSGERRERLQCFHTASCTSCTSRQSSGGPPPSSSAPSSRARAAWWS